MFSQRQSDHDSDFRYHLSFEYDDLGIENGLIRLSISLELENLPSDTSPLVFRPRAAESVNPGHTVETDELISVTLIVEDESTEFGFVIRQLVDERWREIHVRIPSKRVIDLCYRIRHEELEDLYDLLIDQYDKTRLQTLFTFTEDMRKLVDMETSFDIMGDIAAANGRYKSAINETRAQFFKNIVLGKKGGRFHKLYDHTELLNAVELFNATQSFDCVSPEAVYKYCLKDLASGPAASLSDLVRDFDLSQNYPSILRDYQLDVATCFHYLSDGEVIDTLPERVVSDLEMDEYDDELVLAKIGGETFEETASLWRDLIGPAREISENELKFVLGRYFYWRGRHLALRDQHLWCVPLLFEAAIRLSAGVNDKKYSQLSTYNYHLRTGFDHLSNGAYEYGIEHFDEAIDTALDTDGRWGRKRSPMIVTPLRYKTIVEVSGDQLEYSVEGEQIDVDLSEDVPENLSDKISLIDKRIELLDGFFDDDSRQVEVALSHLAAKRFELIANHRMRAQEFELAVEALNEVVKEYAQSGQTSKRNQAISRRKHVSATLAEAKGDFKKAADYHERIASDDDYTVSQQQRRYHEIRKEICRAKFALLRSDDLLTEGLSEAKDRMATVRETASELKYEAVRMQMLLDCLTTFADGEVSSVQEIIHELDRSDRTSEAEGSLGIGYDYRPALMTILSAQRLKQWKDDLTVAELLIRISLTEAFTPMEESRLIDQLSLYSSTTDSEWRGLVPIYTHTNLEQIEMKEGMSTGDYSDVAQKLLSVLEKSLETFVEYHGKRATGDEWKGLLVDDDKKLSMGDLAQFFTRSDALAGNLDCIERVNDLFSTPVINDQYLVQVRNRLDHGYIDDLHRDQWLEVRDRVLEIFETIAWEMPIPIRVKSETHLGTSAVQLFWSHRRRQTWIRCDRTLTSDGTYFLPPLRPTTLEESEILEIHPDDLIQCTSARTLESIDRLA